MARLIVNPDTPDEFELELSEGINTLGRTEENAIQLNHESVRERHAEIHVMDGQSVLLDLASDRGEPVVLVPGTRFQIGEVELEFQISRESLFPESSSQPRIEVKLPLPAPASACSRHPVARASWTCSQCNARFCSRCIAQPYGNLATCPECGAPCHQDRPPAKVEAGPPPGDFWRGIGQAFAYPLRGDGKYLLPAGAVVFAGLEFLSKIVFLIGILIILAIVGYLASMMKEVVRASGMGEDAPPDFPEFEGWYESIFRPALNAIFVGFIAYAPMLILEFILVRNGAEPHWGYDLFSVVWAGFAFPIVWLAYAITDSSSAALNPLMLFRAISRAFPQYCVVALFFVLTSAFQNISLTLLERAGHIPIITAIISWAIVIYFMMLSMRVLGLFYRSYHHRFQW